MRLPEGAAANADLAVTAGAGISPAEDGTGVPPAAADTAAPAGRAASLLDAIVAPDGDAGRPDAAPAVGPVAGTGVEHRYVLLTVAGASYAVPQAFVSELDRVPHVTLVPNVPVWIRGITNRRGDILSVVDVRALLGLDRLGGDCGRMLVVRLSDDSCALGLLVDDVPQIVTVAPSDIRQPEPGLEGPLAPFLSGVFNLAERTVAALDVDLLLRSALIRQFDEPADATSGC